MYKLGYVLSLLLHDYISLKALLSLQKVREIVIAHCVIKVISAFPKKGVRHK